MKLCKPYRSPLQAIFIVVFTAIFVLISAAMARIFTDVSVYLRLAGGCFLMLGTALLFRYTMTEYVYALAESDFSVKRLTGEAGAFIFSIELDKDTEIYTKREFKKLKKKRETTGGASYRQNLTAASVFLVYGPPGKRRYVEIEPNAEFYSILKCKIDDLREKR